MKIIGLFLAFFSCIYAALIKIKSGRNQLSALNSLADCILQIRNALSAKNGPLPEVFENLSRECHGMEKDFFHQLSLLMPMIGEKRLSELWEAALDTCYPELDDEDYQQALKLGFLLGKSDVESQLEALYLCHCSFEDKIKTKRAELPEKNRLVFGLWAIAGAMAVILLI